MRRDGTLSRARRRMIQVVSYIRYDISSGIRGLIYWAPYAWKWRSWDYQYGLDALEHHLVALEKAVREGYHMNAEKDARDIRVTIELLRRKDYYPSKFLAECTREDLKRRDAKQKEDWEYLWKHISRNMKKWWD